MASSASPAVRPAAVAGTWYPEGAPALRAVVESLLDPVPPAGIPGPVLALVSPHAGYAYSGPVAAQAYAQVRGQVYDRVILLGPLHRPIEGSRPGPFMVPAEDAYVTPLGQVAIDRTFVAELERQVPLTPVRRDEEHALEIQLPFLQVALAAPFRLVPMMFGEHIADPRAAARLDRLVTALAGLLRETTARDERTLLVASTDLSHLHNYADVIRTDRRLVDLVAAFDIAGLAAALSEEQVQACGATGLIAALRTAQALGARGARVLAYASSGDVTGDKRPGTYTVGYLAAAAYA